MNDGGRGPEGSEGAEAVLRLDRLRVPVRLGWPEAERREPQSVVVDLCIRFGVRPVAVATDDLTGTVNYAVLAERIREVCGRGEYRLLERLAGALHGALRPLVPAAAGLRVTVTKDPGIAGVEGGASFTLDDRPGNA